MSKFIDNLENLRRAAPSPIGFLPRQPVPPRPSIRLLAIVAPEDLEHAAEFIQGADAVLLPVARQNPPAKRLTRLAAVMGGIPWGGWAKTGHAGVPALAKAGCDFIVFPASGTPLTIAAKSKQGKILEVEASVSDSLLRAVNDLPAEAVLVSDAMDEDTSLTWRHLMIFKRFASILTKPLLALVPSSMDAGEMTALWEAGVDCVVVDTEGVPPGRLGELRKTIDGTRFPARGGRREKMDPVLPAAGSGSRRVVDTDDEEED